MRVLLSSTIFPNRAQPNRGIYILKQANEFKKYCELEIISPRPWVPGFIRSERYAEFARIPYTDTIAGNTVTYPKFFAIPKVLQFLNGILLALGLAPAMRCAVATFKPDVILCFWAYPDGIANVLLGKMLGVPVVIGCLGSDIHELEGKNLQRKIVKYSLAKCARILTVSGKMKEAIVEMGIPAEKVHSIPNGIEGEHFFHVETERARAELDIELDGNVIVCVSRLGFEKGIDLLIRAFALVQDRNATLVLVGGGEEEANLRALAAELGVAERIRFVLDRPHHEIHLWMNSGKICVLPSRTEGHPNVVVEALACGRPVVAADVGGVRESLEDGNNGIIVNPEDPPALARGIDEALARDWDATAISTPIRQRTWNTVAREVLQQCATGAGIDAYESVVESTARGE